MRYLYDTRNSIVIMTLFLVAVLIVGIFVGYFLATMFLSRNFEEIRTAIDDLKSSVENLEKLNYMYKLMLVKDAVKIARWNSIATLQSMNLKYVYEELNKSYDINPSIYSSEALKVIANRITLLSNTVPPHEVQEDHYEIIVLLEKLYERIKDLNDTASKKSYSEIDFKYAVNYVDKISSLVLELESRVDNISKKL